MCYDTLMTFKEFLKKNAWIQYAAIVFAIFAIFPYFMGPSVYESNQSDAVNIFPKNAESKNYRLSATIEETTRFGAFFTQNKEYFVKDVTWPNGGTVGLTCADQPLVRNEKVDCVIGDDMYVVELNKPENYIAP